MTDTMPSFRHQFLISMPHLRDPNFDGTLTYLCDHNEHGALGVIINRPLDFDLTDILEQMDIPATAPHIPVFAGGPVQVDRGFVIHRPQGNYQSTLPIQDGICLTTSRDILVACAENRGPDDILIALGYAGWGAGQLETEIMNNFWLNCPADDEILFHLPGHERLPAALAKLGIDLSQLSSQTGHA